jgi:hypothetical protein
LLRLDPPDPAGAHFQLAKLLRAQRDAGAKRHLLMALEEAPRFREGHRLLLEMAAETTNSPTQRGPTNSAIGQAGPTNVIVTNRPGIQFQPPSPPRDSKAKP